jgi:hypothetical protein
VAKFNLSTAGGAEARSTAPRRALDVVTWRNFKVIFRKVHGINTPDHRRAVVDRA